jgi:hypothetical protein
VKLLYAGKNGDVSELTYFCAVAGPLTHTQLKYAQLLRISVVEASIPLNILGDDDKLFSSLNHFPIKEEIY